jgi:hypothetical protein
MENKKKKLIWMADEYDMLLYTCTSIHVAYVNKSIISTEKLVSK